MQLTRVQLDLQPTCSIGVRNIFKDRTVLDVARLHVIVDGAGRVGCRVYMSAVQVDAAKPKASSKDPLAKWAESQPGLTARPAPVSRTSIDIEKLRRDLSVFRHWICI